MTLLELLVALTLLGTFGTATLRFAHESAVTVGRIRTAEAELASASAFMDAVALWPREALDQRLGARPQGTWTLYVEHPPGDVYLVELREQANDRILIQTALYRPEPQALR